MKMTIIGLGQRRHGVSKQGKDYDGMSVYGTTTDRDVDGLKAEELYFNYKSRVDYPDVKLGDVIDVRYDKNGWITDITMEKPAAAAPK
jgi:hypothetical protein